MEIKDNILEIVSDVTKLTWLGILQLIEGKEDVKLKINGCRISLETIDIPESISGIEICDCIIDGRVEINGLSQGRYISIDSCFKLDIFSKIKISGSSCMSFFFNDIVSKDDDRLSLPLEIENCQVHKFICSSIQSPLFKDVRFLEKFQYTPIGESDKELLFFNSCVFYEGLEINLCGEKLFSLFFDKCKTKIADRYEFSAVALNLMFGGIALLNIKDSTLNGMRFNFALKDIHNIEVRDSAIGTLEMYSASGDNTPKEIYNFQITDSLIDELLLSHRNIVHTLRLDNTVFVNPPQLHGANIPHGSVFPEKIRFLSRSGDSDAACYRTLRYFMESIRDREVEGIFFSLEQESILNKQKGLSRVLSANYFYLKISEHGTNYTRPLLILLLANVFFAIIYAVIASPRISIGLPIDWQLLENSFLFSLKQTLQPFSSLKDLAPLPEENALSTFTCSLLGVFNSLISVSCIALSGLALRWKFKRG